MRRTVAYLSSGKHMSIDGIQDICPGDDVSHNGANEVRSL